MFPMMPLSEAARAAKDSILAIPRTDEPILDDMPPGFGADELEYLHSLALAGSNRAVPEIKKAISRFPGYPTLLNYLRVAYQKSGSRRQADGVLKQLAKEHPDYLFTRVGLAMKELDAERPEKAAEALCPDLDIQTLYPERQVFHFSEMRNFYFLVAIIHARRGDAELAQGVRAALKVIDEDAEIDGVLMREIMLANLRRMKKRAQDDAGRRIEVTIPALSMKIVTMEEPTFHHDPIHELYCHDMDLPEETTREILALPRPTLVEDLARVLDDCIVRTPNFINGLVDEAGECAPHHAVHLLAELDGTEALENLLRFLAMHPDALDFWIGDMDWHPQVAGIIAGDIPRCTAWLKSPGIAARGKGILVGAMEHLAKKEPLRMEEITASLGEVFACLLESPREANVLDTSFLSGLTASAAEMRASGLVPSIKEAYRRNLIEESMVGSLDVILEEIAKPPAREPGNPPLDTRCDDDWDDVLGDSFDAGKAAPWLKDTEPQPWSDAEPAVAASAVGRNDPCPCGSGRKYKKCCGR